VGSIPTASILFFFFLLEGIIVGVRSSQFGQIFEENDEEEEKGNEDSEEEEDDYSNQ
jgi:hypothetical protein